MAEEEKNEETTEEVEEPTAGEASGSDLETNDAPESPDDSGGSDPAHEAEAAAEEPPAEPEADATPDATPPPAAEPQAEPEEILSAKQLRKAARSRHSGETREERSGEQRAAERKEARRAKAAARSRYRARARERRGPERSEGTPPAERAAGAQKVRLGTVVSAKPDKTITVRVEISRRHPTYEKVIRRSNTVHAHDERNEANEGDTVRVVECRPMSRLKRWRLLEIVEKAR